MLAGVGLLHGSTMAKEAREEPLAADGADAAAEDGDGSAAVVGPVNAGVVRRPLAQASAEDAEDDPGAD